MRRSLLQVARADAAKACSSKRSERHVVEVWFLALVKQARLEDFRVMCIESRSNLGDLAFLRKMQRRWGRTSFRDRERLEKSPARSAVLRHSSAFKRLRVCSDARIPRDRLV